MKLQRLSHEIAEITWNCTGTCCTYWYWWLTRATHGNVALPQMCSFASASAAQLVIPGGGDGGHDCSQNLAELNFGFWTAATPHLESEVAVDLSFRFWAAVQPPVPNASSNCRISNSMIIPFISVTCQLSNRQNFRSFCCNFSRGEYLSIVKILSNAQMGEGDKTVNVCSVRSLRLNLLQWLLDN